ncbi:hypothetical protein B5C34_15325 [Pacificimonas flava]|uniref:Uncharacterized protein n=2 Tax=Pacificimonas TaxID=1960290 RepID=A0A219B0N4_9SPHN|nr:MULTISPECIES: glycine zipper domain-containing protein [Pacificimonas]MBZ6379665.1 hypothetical protein [Pacificimonas aurantium]OWV31871.1 hypothetical protein B5C34_15325 [Pacificimonas flava]
MKKKLLAAAAPLAALTMTAACADNYAVEGAAAGAAAGVLADETGVVDTDTGTAAAVGAAVGAAAGYFIDKDDDCDGYDEDGDLDNDCRGLPGYPD